ncbi:MAG TPA: hypothetical protein VGJ91_15755 [Polyangiaceae bacterium]
MAVAIAGDNNRSFGDTSRAASACFVAELIAAVVAGIIVERLKSQAAASLEKAADRSRRRALGVARFGFWLSVILLLLLAFVAVYMAACSMAMSG